jgi:hypothetical protein
VGFLRNSLLIGPFLPFLGDLDDFLVGERSFFPDLRLATFAVVLTFILLLNTPYYLRRHTMNTKEMKTMTANPIHLEGSFKSYQLSGSVVLVVSLTTSSVAGVVIRVPVPVPVGELAAFSVSFFVLLYWVSLSMTSLHLYDISETFPPKSSDPSYTAEAIPELIPPQ